MLSRLLAFGRDDFLRHNAVFFLGSFAVAALNYLYHPVLSRMMSVAHFGEVQALLSVFTMANVMQPVFSMATLNVFANHNKERQKEFRQLYTIAFLGTVGIAILLACVAPLLAKAFRLDSTVSIFVVAALLPISMVAMFGNANLQARKKFGAVATANMLSAGGKLVFAAFFVWLGFATIGAIAGLFVAGILTLWYITFRNRDSIAFSLQRVRWTNALQSEFNYCILILLMIGTTTFLFTADVIIVKYLFSAEIAGSYGGISTVAKIIYFAAGSVPAVLLPHVQLHASRLQNERLLLKALGLTMILGGAAFAVIAVAPALVTRLLIGEQYLTLVTLLPPLAVQIFLLCFINIFLSYSIALHQKSVIFFCLLGLCLSVSFIIPFHGSPGHIVYSLLITNAVVLIALLCRHRSTLLRYTYDSPSQRPAARLSAG